MNAIEAMQTEIGYQVNDMPNLDLPKTDENCLFVGAGDSYVASLVAQQVSGGRALCCHPTDIIQNPSVAIGRDAYFVSISGNTKANILAAHAAKKNGAHTTAITARPASRLAKACDQVIQLKYRSTGVTTAGTISFTSSVLACISLVSSVQLPLDLGIIYRQAEKQAGKVASAIGSVGNSYMMLGNGILYPVAMYGALKFNEVFGAKAFPYPAEEFCHSPLFSLKKHDKVIVMGAKNDDNSALADRARKEGYSFSYVDFDSKNTTELLLQSIFFMQLLALKLAQKRKMTSCYYLKNKKLLKISSDFIYG